MHRNQKAAAEELKTGRQKLNTCLRHASDAHQRLNFLNAIAVLALVKLMRAKVMHRLTMDDFPMPSWIEKLENQSAAG